MTMGKPNYQSSGHSVNEFQNIPSNPKTV